jgi:hypothetical protein
MTILPRSRVVLSYHVHLIQWQLEQASLDHKAPSTSDTAPCLVE